MTVEILLILIEGPDGSGKSTLISTLREAIHHAHPGDHVEVLHKGPPSGTPIEEYEQPLFSYRPGQERHIICDRWHLGEWVYPQVLDRSTRADDANLWHIEAFLETRGAVIVHTTPDPAVVAENVTRRGDDLISVLQLAEITSGYRSVIQRTPLPVYRYDYTTNSPDIFASLVVTYAGMRDTDARRLNPFTTYVGPTRPQALLLGDVRHALRNRIFLSADEDTTAYGAAFGPEAGTSGHFLLSHLPSGSRRLLGLANACDVDNPRVLWQTLGEPRSVVALGQRAFNALQKLYKMTDLVSVGAVPHPQYVRRFHHRHGYAYGRLIADVIRSPRDETRWRPVSPDTDPIRQEAA